MSRVTIDDVLSAKLHALDQPAELCDPSGKVLGRFVPALDESKWEAVTPEASVEELDRRERSAEWHSTQDVLSRIARAERQ